LGFKLGIQKLGIHKLGIHKHVMSMMSLVQAPIYFTQQFQPSPFSGRLKALSPLPERERDFNPISSSPSPKWEEGVGG
jgi:hypothetical protein